MRVITGSARGRKLITLEGDDVRPTTDKVKESLFNIIQFDVEGANFLDLFSGSGQIGIEAISRGARSATFVDKSKKSIEVITKNVSTVGFTSRAKIVTGDSIAFLQRKKETFDIAFLDPPYRTGHLQKALEYVFGVMNDNGIVICESPSDEEMPESICGFSIFREYTYGKMKLTSYTKDETDG